MSKAINLRLAALNKKRKAAAQERLEQLYRSPIDASFDLMADRAVLVYRDTGKPILDKDPRKADFERRYDPSRFMRRGQSDVRFSKQAV